MVCSGKVCAGLSKTECVALSWVTAFRVNIKPKVIREYGDRAWDIESSGFGTQGSLAPIRGIRYICYESLRKLGIWWDLYLVFDVYRIRYAFPPGNLCLFIHLVYAIPNTRTILVSKCMSTINNSLLYDINTCIVGQPSIIMRFMKYLQGSTGNRLGLTDDSRGL